VVLTVATKGKYYLPKKVTELDEALV
jgi:hypothetical protein